MSARFRSGRARGSSSTSDHGPCVRWPGRRYRSTFGDDVGYRRLRIVHRLSIHHDTEHNLRRCVNDDSPRLRDQGGNHDLRPGRARLLKGAESTRLSHQHCGYRPVDTKCCTYPSDTIFKTTTESSAPYLCLIQYTMATVVTSVGLTSRDLLRVSTRLHVNIVASDGIQRRMVQTIEPFHSDTDSDTGCVPPER
jgi:hypothetical protein